jgi:preprotein translocase subunit SecA
MGPLYQFHCLSVDCIDKHQPNSNDRRLAYQADITFGTNNEFGFDYLRDNMAGQVDELVQRKPYPFFNPARVPADNGRDRLFRKRSLFHL